MESLFDFPFVSIITVNLNGKNYLDGLLESIKQINYPPNKIEIIVVDNGSNDGSCQFILDKYPDIRLIKNEQNTGFAFANNQGAKAAAGSYLAFLNNDTKVDKNWLIELLRPVYMDSEAVCAGSKVLSIDGTSLDFAGSMINFEGKGFQVDYGLPFDKDIHKEYEYLPFVNGGAMLVKRDVFIQSGGFDEDFFAYYEDVDFGWRLWVLGYRVVFAPKSIVYHVHHGTSKIFSDDKLRFLKERNALYSVFKNYDEDNLARVFSGTLAGIFSRILTDVKFDYKKYYDFTLAENSASAGDGVQESEAKNKEDGLAQIKMDSQPLSSLMAVQSFLDGLGALRQKRKKIQSMRKRDDKAVFTYFKGQFLSVSADAAYQRNQIDILKSLGIYDIFEKQIKRKLLIISGEVVSSGMAGPAIRVWNFAKVLSEHLDITLAIPNDTDMQPQVFKIQKYKDEASVKAMLESCDIVLCGGMTFSKFKCIRNSDKYIIMDIYDPYNLATLTEYGDQTIERQLEVYKSVHFITNEMLYYGDFYICASERQRDFWLGMLAALNRVNPYSYNQDPAMRKLIDIVPFGLPSNRPMHTENVLKGKIEGISKEDKVIIWGGGIYNWFDPLTLIRAMAIVLEKRKDIKLFFLGVKHPNPQVKELSMVNETVELAKKLGVYNNNTFFNFGWVDYEKRQDYFLESDIGIITHPDHIETRFAFRTRILDYIWTGLPVISTRGDSLSDMVESKDLGLTVNAQDARGLAEAIIELSENSGLYKKCRENISSIAADFTWERVCRPIIDFCADPVSSAVRQTLRPDQVHSSVNVLDICGSGAPADLPSQNLNTAAEKQKGKLYLAKRFFYHFKSGGAKSAFKVYSNYLKGK
ncbi:MAG: glycosyltransferase [Actinobacteria bacterium]|nr:glycosyltransferase [Actinomycetota bacterium]